MPYTKSSPRATAEARVKELKDPFNYAKLRPKKLSTSVRDSIYRSCVFQLSAILEDYVRGVLSSWLNSLHGYRTDLIPLYTRAIFAARVQEEFFRRYIGLRDETSLVTGIGSIRESLQILNDAASIPSVDLYATVIRDKKFPSARNLDALFKRIGAPNMMNNISKRTKSDAKLAITSFMDVRNSLAHEGPPSITDLDVSRYFEQVSSWINAIDRELHSHVCSVSEQRFWPA